MCDVDEKDRVTTLEGVPQSSVGAPLPFVMADEHRVILAYYLEDRVAGWDGSSTRMVDPMVSQEPIALIRFQSCAAFMFGPPNDEAFAGHPLASRGLHPYDAFRIEDSSWIRRLERMNSVHRHHRPDRFWKLQHLVFTFHDSVFECVCQTFDIRSAHGSIRDMIPEMVMLLQRDKTQNR
jgi:hypothetical protein